MVSIGEGNYWVVEKRASLCSRSVCFLSFRGLWKFSPPTRMFFFGGIFWAGPSNDRSQLVGNLWTQESSVETSHGIACSNYVGTIRICLTMDEGLTIKYHIPSAIYAPDSPFNILGIPFFGSFLGQDNTHYPTQDDNGTYIISSASRSHFIWDHGKHKRHFCHDKRSLPILFLETGNNSFGAFCSW